MSHRRRRTRQGAVLVLCCVSLIGMCAMLALAIDIGTIAVARTQAQNAADAAAMAGARVLNGDRVANNNYAGAKTAAVAAAGANRVLSKSVAAGQCTIDVGSYYYDDNKEQFTPKHTSKAPEDNWTLVRARVEATPNYGFARVLGVTPASVAAVGTAAHRPRDVAIFLDVGGSMRYDSLLGIPHSGSRDAGKGGEASGSNNPESVFPLFGAYSDTPKAGLQRTTPATIGDNFYGLANITVETLSGPPIVDYFYQTAGGNPVKAFTPAADGKASTPGGDNYLKSGKTYAKTVADITGSTKKHTGFETNGYENYVNSFAGYTEGPRYWGKTFFIWPPDPRPTMDWRSRFFFDKDGKTPVNDNTRLWDTSGNWRAPRTSGTNDNYRINYPAILAWIKQAPCPFPPALRSGRILYYDAIPSTITGTDPKDPNERFWKKYIDYVLGVYQSGTNTWEVITPKTGYGSDFTWGTLKISARPSGKDTRYMDYQDNPKRPRLHFWFGAMTMIDFLGNHNRGLDLDYAEHYWWPGTCTESPNYACKLGLQAALRDIEQNHPNDHVSLIFFSNPKYSAGDKKGRFNVARSAMGRDYNRMIDALWFPEATLGGGEIRYDDPEATETPRAFGQTCYAQAFMLAFNQFSAETSLRGKTTPSGLAGGYGRRGSNKLVILESDGQPNYLSDANWVSKGKGKNYYDLAPPVHPSKSGPGVNTQIYNIVDKMVADEKDGGFGTARKPVLIHTIAFGNMFESFSTDPDKATALAVMQNIQAKGNTQGAGDPLQSYKIITGTQDERIAKMRTAFSTIMQHGVQVSLIE